MLRVHPFVRVGVTVYLHVTALHVYTPEFLVTVYILV